jgi:hypothetical protein
MRSRLAPVDLLVDADALAVAVEVGEADLGAEDVVVLVSAGQAGCVLRAVRCAGGGEPAGSAAQDHDVTCPVAVGEGLVGDADGEVGVVVADGQCRAEVVSALVAAGDACGVLGGRCVVPGRGRPRCRSGR